MDDGWTSKKEEEPGRWTDRRGTCVVVFIFYLRRVSIAFLICRLLVVMDLLRMCGFTWFWWLQTSRKIG